MKGHTTIVGVSAHFHDAACSLIRDGKLLAAIEEERLTRIKHDPATPINAFKACLSHAGLDVTDIDCLAFYENTEFGREPSKTANATSFGSQPATGATRLVKTLRNRLGYEGEIRTFRHHLSHAASAFYPSGFNDAAVLTVDGVGERTTTAYWRAESKGLELLEEVQYPHSLGLLYSTFTAYLGFKVNDDEYKVMGLASYGKPTLLGKLRQLISYDDEADFTLDMRYFDYERHDRMYSTALETLLGHRARRAAEPLEDFHAEVASSVQVLLEEILLQKLQYLHKRVNCDRLCLAGGVALNCVANGRIHRETPFTQLFVQPAASDAGGSLGAAALAHKEIFPDVPLDLKLRDAFLGPSFKAETIRNLLRSTPIPYREFADNQDALLEQTARYLAGGSVVSWFQGRMEFGPRALGGRSILADPRASNVADRINAVVKQREKFRPFAPAVLYDRANSFFALPYESPFMLETCAVLPGVNLPAITHIDGSARVQTVDPTSNHPFARLLAAFARLTGCPVLLNTSFNMNDEPIVCTPADALTCFLRSESDVLVLENFMVKRTEVPPRLIEAVRRSYLSKPPGVSEHVYTLV